jgi:hypothetical protein
VKFLGILGVLAAIAPSLLFYFKVPDNWHIWASPLLILYASVLTSWITERWSRALHERAAELRKRLADAELLTDEDRKRPAPGRVPWMPAFVGMFERAFYALLIGFDASSGATFIAVWVGLKLAGGWQLWSKGTTYGNALFFTGLLGNAMSVSIGVVTGLVLYSWFHP